MAEAIIRHTGIVRKVTAKQVETSIVVSSACSGCHAKGACGSADTSSRIITTERINEQGIKEGDRVNIEGAQSTGLRAVFYAYVLPFILLMIVLVMSSTVLHTSELRAGLYSLLILPPYYFVLYLLRDKFEKKYTFRIVS